jgi:hypothetical protein
MCQGHSKATEKTTAVQAGNEVSSVRDVKSRWQEWWMLLLVGVPILLGLLLIASRLRVWLGM